MKNCLCQLPLLATLVAVGMAQTPAAPDPLDALLRDSPFIPAGGGARPTAGPAGPLTLRGVVFENGAYSFSIYDEATRESVWVRLQEGGHAFVARSFNREKDELTVEYQGSTQVLPLQAARVATGDAGVPPPNAPAMMPTAAPAQVAGPRPSGPDAAAQNEAQRLQNLADEIRRRRNVGNPHPQPPRN